MNVRYFVELETSERQQLEALVTGGTCAVRRIKRAQILLAADAGGIDGRIAGTIRVNVATVYRVRRRFVEDGLEQALSEDPRPAAREKLSTTEEAMLVALPCSALPRGEELHPYRPVLTGAERARRRWKFSVTPSGIGQYRGTSTKTVARRGLASNVEAFRGLPIEAVLPWGTAPNRLGEARTGSSWQPGGTGNRPAAC